MALVIIIFSSAVWKKKSSYCHHWHVGVGVRFRHCRRRVKILTLPMERIAINNIEPFNISPTGAMHILAPYLCKKLAELCPLFSDNVLCGLSCCPLLTICGLSYSGVIIFRIFPEFRIFNFGFFIYKSNNNYVTFHSI